MNIPTPAPTSNYRFKGRKASAEIAAGEETPIDFYISPDDFPYGVAINGCSLITAGAELGDSVRFQIVDTLGICGAGIGFVVEEFADWFVDPKNRTEGAVDYGDVIPPYFTLRCLYKSVGATPVKAYLNHFCHRVFK